MEEVRNVFVASKNRDTSLFPAGNNYVLHLTTPIKDIHKVELLTCSVPNTLYNVTPTSNNLSFTVADDGALDTYVLEFSVPPGFYSGAGLATEITNAVSNISNIEAIWQSNEGKFLFRRGLDQGTAPWHMNVMSNNLCSVLGFTEPANTTMISVNVPDFTSATGPVPLYANNTTYSEYSWIKSNVVAQLNPNPGIFLDIEELRTTFNEDCKASTQSNFYSGQNISRTFGLIPMDVSSGAIKNFKKESDYNLYAVYPRPISSLDRLTIKWLDKDGQQVDFNGANDNSFILRFHTLRRSL